MPNDHLRLVDCENDKRETDLADVSGFLGGSILVGRVVRVRVGERTSCSTG